MRKYLFVFVGLMLLVVLPQTAAYGQKVDSWASIDKECFFLLLNEGWQDDQGTNYRIPILPPANKQRLVLRRTFALPDSFPSELVLWIGRYAWEMEVLLNGKYLEVAQQPFHGCRIALEREWLQTGSNQIELRLSKRGLFPFQPLPVLGMWEGVGLLTSSQLEYLDMPRLKKSDSPTDTLALIAPYYGKSGFQFDEFEAARILLPLLKKDLRVVYFWFEPDRSLLDMCKKMGLERAYAIADSQRVCAINYYPYHPIAHGKSIRFWLDSLGRRTSYYGEYEYWEEKRKPELRRAALNFFAILSILPFLAMAMIKLFSPSYFHSLFATWIGALGRNENGTDSIFTSIPLNIALNAIKVLCQTSFLSLGIFYLQHMNLWQLTERVVSSESLFSMVFNGRDTLLQLFLKVLAILLIWQIARMLAWFMAGRIFGKKQMVLKGFGLEFLSDMPLILFMGLPWIIGLYTINEGGEFLVAVMLFLFGIYGLRKLWVLFRYLGRIFNFSSGIKILYICTFNVLPYLIWL